jgi:antirestriction protein ArdC
MNVYEIVTEKIVEQLEKGYIPWRQPWGATGKPRNFLSQQEYRGVNVILLSCARSSSPYWLTLKQANDMGGQIKKGAKAFPVIYFQWKDEDEKAERYPILRYYRVFNAVDIDGISFPAVETRVFEKIPQCEKVVAHMPNRPAIQHRDDYAYYKPPVDLVNMPDKALFHNDEGYYATLFHELSHSTGHASRLDRHAKEGADCRFGSASYAREELVAEMSAAFLCASAGIENLTLENAAAYISSWIKVLRTDKRMLIIAAAQAQKAADYILGLGSHTQDSVSVTAGAL